MVTAKAVLASDGSTLEGLLKRLCFGSIRGLLMIPNHSVCSHLNHSPLSLLHTHRTLPQIQIPLLPP